MYAFSAFYVLKNEHTMYAFNAFLFVKIKTDTPGMR